MYMGEVRAVHEGALPMLYMGEVRAVCERGITHIVHGQGEGFDANSPMPTLPPVYFLHHIKFSSNLSCCMRKRHCASKDSGSNGAPGLVGPRYGARSVCVNMPAS